METASDFIKQSLSIAIPQVGNEILGFLSNHIFGVVVFCLAISLIIFVQSVGFMRFSSGINSGIGSLLNRLFFILIFIIAYWIFGTNIIDDMWFWLIGFSAYKVTGSFLKGVGFWSY